MNLGDNDLGCDFCEHTSRDFGRVIYQCDVCDADCCSDCSENDPEDSYHVLCAPDPSSGNRGCAALDALEAVPPGTLDDNHDVLRAVMRAD